MKLLIDENLPPRLAAWLRDQGVDAAHVHELSLDHTPDPRIRDLAGSTGRMIVSKDVDFTRIQRPSDGPVLRLTCGNLPRAELTRRFAACWPNLRQRLDNCERVVESDLKSATQE